MGMKWPFSFSIPFEIKRFLQNEKVVLGSYFLFFLPLLCLSIQLSSRLRHLKELENEIDKGIARFKQAKDVAHPLYPFPFASQGEESYVRDVIESIILLKTEKEILTRIANHPNFRSSQPIKNRLESIMEENNRLTFSERNRVSQNGIEEVELVQNGAVEVNGSDLKAILSAVEGVSARPSLLKKRPYLAVKGFHLNRKKCAERESYLLEMHLIKRGYVR